LSSETDPLRELEDLRAGAAERGLAMVLLRHDDPQHGVQLEPLFLGTEPQEGGLTALRILDREDMRFELLAYEDDLRRVLDEPVDVSQPGDAP
jgi:hypothetical protein